MEMPPRPFDASTHTTCWSPTC